MDILKQIEGMTLDEQLEFLDNLKLPDRHLGTIVDVICEDDRDAHFKAYAKFGERIVNIDYKELIDTLMKEGYSGPIPSRGALV